MNEFVTKVLLYNQYLKSSADKKKWKYQNKNDSKGIQQNIMPIVIISYIPELSWRWTRIGNQFNVIFKVVPMDFFREKWLH